MESGRGERGWIDESDGQVSQRGGTALSHRLRIEKELDSSASVVATHLGPWVSWKGKGEVHSKIVSLERNLAVWLTNE